MNTSVAPRSLDELTKFMRLLLVPFDHLNADRGVLKNADPATDIVLLVQSERMITGRSFHKERLFFLISSARHFAMELEKSGFTVLFIEAETTTAGIAEARESVGELPVVCAEPSSFMQRSQLAKFGVEFIENDFFLTPRELFADWAGSQKTFVMENFYRLQRKRLGLLMEGDKPSGGQWNFDHDNRLPPPKNYTWPERLLQP